MKYFITIMMKKTYGEEKIFEGHEIPEETLHLIIEKYGGNPVFAIEVTIEPEHTITIKETPEAPECKPYPKQIKKRVFIDIPKVKALRKAGWTYEKIADEFNCSPQTIINRLNQEGEA